MARGKALLLAVMATFVLGACSSPKSKLVGTWQADMALTAAKANIALPGGVQPKQNLRVIFEADGKYRKELTGEGQTVVMEEGTFEAKGPALKFNAAKGGSPGTDTMVFEVNEKEKILRLDNEKTGGRLSSVYFRRQ